MFSCGDVRGAGLRRVTWSCQPGSLCSARGSPGDPTRRYPRTRAGRSGTAARLPESRSGYAAALHTRRFVSPPLPVARIPLPARCAGLTSCPRSSSVGAGYGSVPPRRAPLALLPSVRRDVCPLPKIRLSSESLREGTRTTELPPRCSVPALTCPALGSRCPRVSRGSGPGVPVLVAAPVVPGECCDSFSFCKELGVCVCGCWH